MENLLPEGGHPSLNQSLVLQSVPVAVQDRPVLGCTPTALGQEAWNSCELDGEGGHGEWHGAAWTAAFVQCLWGPGNRKQAQQHLQESLRSSFLFPVEVQHNLNASFLAFSSEWFVNYVFLWLSNTLLISHIYP